MLAQKQWQRPGNEGKRPGNEGQRSGNEGQRPRNEGQRPGNEGQRSGNEASILPLIIYAQCQHSKSAKMVREQYTRGRVIGTSVV